MYHRYLAHIQIISHKEFHHLVEPLSQLSLQSWAIVSLGFLLPIARQMKLEEYPNTFHHQDCLHRALSY